MFTLNGVQSGCYKVIPEVEFVAREAMVLAISLCWRRLTGRARVAGFPPKIPKRELCVIYYE